MRSREGAPQDGNQTLTKLLNLTLGKHCSRIQLVSCGAYCAEQGGPDSSTRPITSDRTRLVAEIPLWMLTGRARTRRGCESDHSSIESGHNLTFTRLRDDH